MCALKITQRHTVCGAKNLIAFKVIYIWIFICTLNYPFPSLIVISPEKKSND